MERGRAQPAAVIPLDPRTHARRWKILAVLALSLVIVSLDNTVLNVALPSIQRSLGCTARDLQWIVDAYTLVFAGLVLLGGNLGDRFGRKRCLQAGLVLLCVGSVLAVSADTTMTLILARAVMGVGGALIMPATLSITTAVFHGAERGKAIGLWAACAGIGVALGPIAGGWLVEHFWWGSVFLINIPVVAVALLSGWRLLPESRDSATAPADLLGAGLSIVGITALVYAIIAAPDDGWLSMGVLVTAAIGTVCLAAFARVEMRSPYPMLPMSFFRSARFSAASLAISLTFFALIGSLFYLTQFLQIVRGYSSLAAGLRTLPVAVGLGLASARGPALAARYGPRRVVTIGMALTAVGLAMVGFIRPDTSYWFLMTSLAIMGLGMGTTMAPATASIMGSVPAERGGVGSAVNDSIRQLSGALGVAVLGSFLQYRYASDLAPRLEAVPSLSDATRRSALDSVAGAHSLSPSISALTSAANDAFVVAMNGSAGVAAGVVITGALAVALFLPDRERSSAVEPTASVDRSPDQPASRVPVDRIPVGRHRRPAEPVAAPVPRLVFIRGRQGVQVVRLDSPHRHTA